MTSPLNGLVQKMGQNLWIQSRHLERPPRNRPQGKSVNDMTLRIRKQNLITFWAQHWPFLSVRSMQTLESNSLPGYVTSHSHQDLICSNTGEGLTRWRCSTIPVSGSDLLKHWKRDSHPEWVISHFCQWFWWIWSAQTLERDSQPGGIFSHSCQWFRSMQTLERDSHAGGVFSLSYQWFSNTGEGLTCWRGVQPFLSVVLICSNTGERLTSWRSVLTTILVVSGSDLLKHWRGTHMLEGWSIILVSGSDFLKHWRGTHTLEGCSIIPVSGSGLLKHWRGTYLLETCSPILVSGFDLLKHWRGTHFLDTCSPILVSGFDLLKHWRATHNLNVFPKFLVSKIHVHLLHCTVLPLYSSKNIIRFQ